ncbi:YidB family protein [Hyphomicrobium sp.]|uniref:YidB family protein n=1 Tax=Hyphomicrobium sp. TaxID=82 RepID=UPI002E3636EB|nr:YidB family protein [Hyphomicrobium sp.]HEX2839860.1 YidB family protein [Hyphomicrobium sp.]
MSWSDTLKGLVASAEQTALPGLVQNLLGAEGLQAVLGKLRDAGLGDQVASWLDSNRANLPISVDQLRAALGDEHIRSIATSLGLPVDAVLDGLAKYLPEAAAAAPEATQQPSS